MALDPLDRTTTTWAACTLLDTEQAAPPDGAAPAAGGRVAVRLAGAGRSCGCQDGVLVGVGAVVVGVPAASGAGAAGSPGRRLGSAEPPQRAEQPAEHERDARRRPGAAGAHFSSMCWKSGSLQRPPQKNPCRVNARTAESEVEENVPGPVRRCRK